jgi:hypothetical protein
MIQGGFVAFCPAAGVVGGLDMSGFISYSREALVSL